MDATGVATIDLDALARNYHRLKAAAPAECGAVVKADAYGLGMVPVAKRLEREGCRHFFVASVGEAAGLRAILPEQEIYVLEGVRDESEGLFAERRLVPVLNSLHQIDRWARFARSSHGPAPAPCVLHVDTGMCRLGLTAEEVVELDANRERLERLRVDYIMTHLACSDEPNHPLNARQLAAFHDLRSSLPPAKTSIGASAGCLLGHCGDLARAGIGLYGGNPFSDRPNPMEPVLRLQGRILQVRQITRAATVGYGATFEAGPPARLATVGVGYADGYPRALSNRGVAIFDGFRIPVVGRVSMDLITLDVSEVPAERVVAGRMVDLVGDDVTVDDLAEAAGTISYEILTRLGPRVQRVYRGAVE